LRVLFITYVLSANYKDSQNVGKMVRLFALVAAWRLLWLAAKLLSIRELLYNHRSFFERGFYYISLCINNLAASPHPGL